MLPRRWRWAIYNAIVIGSVLRGGLGGHPAAANLATFLIVLWAVTSGMAWSIEDVREQVRRLGRPVPKSVEWVANLTIIVAAAAAGWFGLAALTVCAAAIDANLRGDERR